MYSFLIQLVGLQDGGIISPDSAYQLQDKPCLTVGQQDRNRGVGLYWHTCESETLGPMGVDPETGKPKRIHPMDPEVHKEQLFQFTKTGQIRHKGTGMCIRREKCGRFQYMYDLTECDGVGSISVFAVNRPIAGEIDHQMAMGSPYQAVISDACDLCGPYFLYERCLSEGQPSHGAQGCIRGWQAEPGWTNGNIHGNSQYVGDEATLGASSGTDYPELSDKLNWRDQFQDQAEMAGVGQTEDDGLCGSFVTDQPVLNSVFYFHHNHDRDQELV